MPSLSGSPTSTSTTSGFRARAARAPAAASIRLADHGQPRARERAPGELTETGVVIDKEHGERHWADHVAPLHRGIGQTRHRSRVGPALLSVSGSSQTNLRCLGIGGWPAAEEARRHDLDLGRDARVHRPGATRPRLRLVPPQPEVLSPAATREVRVLIAAGQALLRAGYRALLENVAGIPSRARQRLRRRPSASRAGATPTSSSWSGTSWLRSRRVHPRALPSSKDERDRPEMASRRTPPLLRSAPARADSCCWTASRTSSSGRCARWPAGTSHCRPPSPGG